MDKFVRVNVKSLEIAAGHVYNTYEEAISACKIGEDAIAFDSENVDIECAYPVLQPKIVLDDQKPVFEGEIVDIPAGVHIGKKEDGKFYVQTTMGEYVAQAIMVSCEKGSFGANPMTLGGETYWGCLAVLFEQDGVVKARKISGFQEKTIHVVACDPVKEVEKAKRLMFEAFLRRRAFVLSPACDEFKRAEWLTPECRDLWKRYQDLWRSTRLVVTPENIDQQGFPPPPPIEYIPELRRPGEGLGKIALPE